MAESTTAVGRSIKVGVITDQTGALSLVGIANANVATLYPGNAKFTAGSACSGLYRGLRLWAAALKEAAIRSLLDHT